MAIRSKNRSWRCHSGIAPSTPLREGSIQELKWVWSIHTLPPCDVMLHLLHRKLLKPSHAMVKDQGIPEWTLESPLLANPRNCSIDHTTHWALSYADDTWKTLCPGTCPCCLSEQTVSMKMIIFHEQEKCELTNKSMVPLLFQWLHNSGISKKQVHHRIHSHQCIRYTKLQMSVHKHQCSKVVHSINIRSLVTSHQSLKYKYLHKHFYSQSPLRIDNCPGTMSLLLKFDFLCLKQGTGTTNSPWIACIALIRQ